ncbi:SAC3 family protein A [Malania oleifera]|uniref:SAC3 family protein A n=1 Tax=Malania oleifera TaxID=397392 RepID=UPI0025ADE0FD|nr:SAC3 family protein A [Malania oleifera]
MMNQGGNTDTISSLDPNSLEKHQAVGTSQGHASSYLPSTTGSEAASWAMHRVDNCSVENGILTNSSYHHDQRTEPHLRNFQDGSNVASLGGNSSSLVAANVQQEYNGYASYQGSSDPYGYANAGYAGYYSSYPQQSNHSYTQPVGAYQNTGAPYQPLSSFQNTGSYAGPASYSSTYYNPADYQTSGGYQSSGYSNQTNLWNGHYANYTSHQYPNYTPDSNGTYSSNTATATPLHYQQDYKQWADYYSQTEVSCAPGTENISVTSTSNLTSPIAGVSSGYLTSNSQPPQPYNPSWRPEPISSQLPSLQPSAVMSDAHDGYWKQGSLGFPNNHVSPLQPHFQKPLDSKPTYDNFQDQQIPACPQGPNPQHPATHQVAQSYQTPLQTVSSIDTRRVSKLQIPTNPRIASNLALGLPKTEKDTSAISPAAKPAYISVSLPKPNDKVLPRDAADSILKTGMFPPSLRGYVERALARCKDDTQMAACQIVMKEVITKATADGTLYTRDWDIEPLFPLPNSDPINKDSPSSTPASSLTKYKRSPSRRSKSRWEPIADEKLIDKPAPTNHSTIKYSGWVQFNEVDRKFSSGKSDGKEDDLNNTKFLLSEPRTANKNSQRPVKRQCLGDDLRAAADGDASSDSDKEQSLTAYYSGAMALANSPEERKKRENRSKRFEKGHGHRAEINHFRPKGVGVGNLYTKRATALVLSKGFEDGSSRAVEDIDWDSLTVKGTCQEIEKRYLRLTSAPDPSTVRPEEVLEKALDMVQNSQKNYLYKCDQLKSIRQDLTVQRIHNKLTVQVYETHARLALEVGDLPEYNQCQSQLKALYAEGIEGCYMEFSAYNLLCVIMHSNNNRDLLSSMSRLSDTAKKDEAVKHALAVRAAVTSGNYVMFFRLYKTAPNLNTCLMDLYVEKMRYAAVRCMSRSYRPMVPVSYIAKVLGFISVLSPVEGSEVRDADGLEECVEWLKAHGACLVGDSIGETQLDTKASSSSLYMPESEDAVAHGDSNLAVNDFLTRTSS